MKEQILKVENLYYSYGTGDAVLNGVNVEIYEGEKIAVVGSNGSGKSTFFLNINGVLIPDQGEIGLTPLYWTKSIKFFFFLNIISLCKFYLDAL